MKAHEAGIGRPQLTRRAIALAIGIVIVPLACHALRASAAQLPQAAVGRANKGLVSSAAVPSWAKRERVHFLPGAGASGALSGAGRQAGSLQPGSAAAAGQAEGSSGGEMGALFGEGEGAAPERGLSSAGQRLEQRENTDPPLRYHEGGNVQREPHVYAIFWGANWNGSTGSALRAKLLEMYEGLSGSSFQGILTQYFDKTGHISPDVSVTSYTDASIGAPTSVNDEMLQAEVSAAIAANGWTAGFDSQFVVLPAPGSTYEEGFDTGFCGYHGVTESGGYSYAFVPYIGDAPFHAGCIGYGWTNDIVTSMVAAHEYAESATDPQLDAWFTEAGYEVADICATKDVEVTEGSLAGSWVQGLWDDSQAQCSISDPAPPYVYAVTEAGRSPAWHEARLRGVVNPEGADTRYRFEYGPTASYGTSVPVGELDAGSGRANLEVAKSLVGLPGGIYHYRLVATNETGTMRGEDQIAVSPDFASSSLPQPPNSGSGEHAYDVSCVSSDRCVAVGSNYSLEVHDTVTLAELWDGSSWSPMQTPNPPGLEEGWRHKWYARLTGVSCASASECIAVGDYRDASETIKPLVERWNGSAWTMVPVSAPAGAAATAWLFRVSCASAAACTALGGYENASLSEEEFQFLDHWDGSEWSAEAITGPSGATRTVLRSVSCPSASACVAVGFYDDGSGVTHPLAERFDGAEWSVESTPTPSGAAKSTLLHVSCPSAGACIATGYDSSAYDGELAERWDGSEWSIVATPVDPSESAFAYPIDLSCASADSCTAVGDRNGGFQPGVSPEVWAEHWNGSRWSIIGMPELPDPANYWHERWITAVSCAPGGVCAAVGSGLSAPYGGLSPYRAFAENEFMPPFASFAVSPESPTYGRTVSFDASSSSDPGATVTRYEWSFGDGSTATGPTPSHTYAKPGAYPVKLTITASEGKSASVSHQVTVADVPPIAAFSVATLAPTATEPVAFDASASSDPDGTVRNYEWSFGDGSVGAGPKPSHVYAHAGEYTVTLTVTDNEGVETEVSHSLDVADAPPTASFAVGTSSPTATEPVAFDASASSDVDGSIANYEWDFGDGGRATGASPSHAYAHAGEYIVTLKVTDNEGKSAEASHLIAIADAAPVAAFSAIPEATLAGQPVAFDASASRDPDGSIASYEWNFGDGGTAVGATPSHAYANPGEYTVTLTVTDNEGRHSEASRHIRVAEPSLTGGGEPPLGSSGSIESSPAVGATGASGAFAIQGASVRCGGGIVLRLSASGPGVFAARATSAPSSRTGRWAASRRSRGRCLGTPGARHRRAGKRRLNPNRHHRHSTHRRDRGDFGHGSTRLAAAGSARLVIRPRMVAVRWLRRHPRERLRVQISLTFSPSADRAPDTERRTIFIGLRR